MEYRALLVFCECGQPPFRIAEVGLTANHQLLIRWWCAGCKRMVHATKRLSECWRECPPQIAETVLANDCEVGAGEEDVKFLAALGVRFP